MKTIFTILLFFISLELRAQFFIDAEGSVGFHQVYTTLGVGYQFKSGLTLRWLGSYGNFGKETRSTDDLYTGLTVPYAVHESEFSNIIKYSSSCEGIGTGVGTGYTFRLNEKHGIYAEVMGQYYIVKDAINLQHASWFGPSAGKTWNSAPEEHQHMSWSAGLGVSHQIRLNHWLSLYYGIRANYFGPVLKKKDGTSNGYTPTKEDTMYGLEPTLHAGLKFTLQRKEN
jgi:hypothetical protein